MAFQIKNFPSIAASIINHFRSVQTAVTDFNIGSVIRTTLEAPAVEIDELYQQFFNGVREAIPVSIFNSFDFDKLPALPASGLMRVTITSSLTDTVIPAGSVFANSSLSTNYVSQTDVTIAAGDTTGDVLVAASAPGIAGNISAGKSFQMAPQLANFVSATNLASFVNGQIEETEDQRKQRFSMFISTLPRGTVPGLEYGASTAALFDSNGLETERVRTVSVVEPYVIDDNDPSRHVIVYIHNGVGSTSTALLERAQAVIDGYKDEFGRKIPGWKAAGVPVDVVLATEVNIDIAAVLTAADGYDPATLSDLAEAALDAYIRAIPIGGSYLEAEAIFRVKSIEGVVNITGLPSDMASDANEKLMPDDLVVTTA